MQFHRFGCIPAVASALCASCACTDGDRGGSSAAEQRQVADAMERYQADARASAFSSMADHFAADGMLLEPGIEPVRTREAIRAFLTSFPGARVERADATPESIEVFGDTAYLWGEYSEELSFPGQPVSEQRGKFVAEWIRRPREPWLMHRLMRIPVATTEQVAPAK